MIAAGDDAESDYHHVLTDVDASPSIWSVPRIDSEEHEKTAVGMILIDLRS